MKRSHTLPLPEAPSPEAADLLERLCQGELTDAETGRLEALVTGDPQVRQFYVRYLHMHAALPTLLGPLSAAVIAEEVSRSLPERTSALWFHRRGARATIWALAVAVNFLLVGLLALLLSPGLREQMGWNRSAQLAEVDAKDHASQADLQSVRLTHATDCRWGGPAESAPVIGEELLARSLHLESGVAELTCGEGVRLAIHGPTMLRLDSSKHVAMTVGSLLVRAERSGRGFTVATPTATIVDLGTEFGVSLEENGQHEVQVFEGSVEVRGARGGGIGSASQLRAGEAMTFSAKVAFVETRQTIAPADPRPFDWLASSPTVSSFPATAQRLKGTPLRLVSGGKPVTGVGTYESAETSFSPSAVTDGRLRDLGFGDEWSYWVAADDTQRADLTIDLETEHEIAELRLQPTHNGDWRNRGTKDFRILVSVDGNEFIEVAKGTLPCVFNQTEVSTERYPLTQPVRGRYVKFEALSWYGLAAGLNEIQVFTSTR